MTAALPGVVGLRANPTPAGRFRTPRLQYKNRLQNTVRRAGVMMSLSVGSARLAGPSAARVRGRTAAPRAAARPVTAAAAADPKIRIKLKSFETDLLAESVEAIKAAVDSTGATMSGPVNLPVRIRRYCVLRSPHVNKKSREHFESRTHSRLMDIKDISAQTVDKLMTLDLPAGVDVQVKL